MSRKFSSLLACVLAACAHATTTSAPVAVPPAPVAHAIPAALPPAPPIPANTDKAGLPRNWQLLDESTDHIAGVSSERAMKELLAGKQPKRTVLVAVIDGGVDTAHVDLKANLWMNPKETPGNKADDDKNGYADDVRGWNFIGGRDGRNIEYETFEATRVNAACRRKAPRGDYSQMPAAERAECIRAAVEFDKQSTDMNAELPGIQQADQVLTAITKALQAAMHTDAITDEAVAKFQPTTPEGTRARTAYMEITAQGITRKVIADALKEIGGRIKYGLDSNYNPRPIVGDDPSNMNERSYGNPDVMGPDAKHGTHVSGIIAAVRGNNAGIDGIAPAVRLMMVRTIPNGDERDKDVANAIRYAVDNGAQVINMSFGKPFSPNKSVVDAAVKYADAHGVLMIHASGNENANNDTVPSFPNQRYLDGGRPRNWIEVGASSWKGGADVAAEFSNYGKKEVDLFAPGVDVMSTVPGGEYERDSGTSMAAPVVTGVAALIMAYYPELSANEVKQILLNSATRHPDQMVVRPGAKNGEQVPFGSLSATGGIVNAYSALKMAAQVVQK